MAYDVNKVIIIALAEVGYLEKKSNSNLDSKTANAGSKNYTKYGRDMHKLYPSVMDFPAAWCDCFVDWCFYKAYGVCNAKGLLCGNFNDYTVASAQLYKNKDAWHTSNPKVGDQIFFKNSSRICHTGLVYKVTSTTVYTIEGNTSGASGVIANGGGVCKKSYPLSYSRIAGYGRPNYGTKSSTSTSTTTSKTPTSKIDTVKEVQTWINSNYNTKLTIDGKCGSKTKIALIKALQTELNQTYKAGLKVDGIFGSKTKSAIRVLKKGAKNDVVKVLQAMLVCHGYSDAYVDGDYGSGTEKAVIDYKTKKGLTPNGNVGKKTFGKLCA